MKATTRLITIGLLLVIVLTACGGKSQENVVKYALTTNVVDGKMVFVGIGTGIDGVNNPILNANVGDQMEITLTSGDGSEHNIAFPDFNATSEHVKDKGSVTLKFTVDKGGSFVYFCEIPGHRQAGMEGKLEVTGASTVSTTANDTTSMPGMVMTATSASSAPTSGADIARDPTDLPAPIGDRAPTNVRIDLETKEV